MFNDTKSFYPTTPTSDMIFYDLNISPNNETNVIIVFIK